MSTPRQNLNDLLQVFNNLVHIYYIHWGPRRATVTLGYENYVGCGELTLGAAKDLASKWTENLEVWRKRTPAEDGKGGRGWLLKLRRDDLVEYLGEEPIKQQWPRLGSLALVGLEAPVRVVHEPDPGRGPGRPRTSVVKRTIGAQQESAPLPTASTSSALAIPDAEWKELTRKAVAAQSRAHTSPREGDAEFLAEFRKLLRQRGVKI